MSITDKQADTRAKMEKGLTEKRVALEAFLAAVVFPAPVVVAGRLWYL